MDVPRDRLGTLGGKSIRLAKWRDTPYTRRYAPVLPERRDIEGQPTEIAPDPTVRYWHIDDWSKGEGFRNWEPGGYNVAKTIQVVAGRGLAIGPSYGSVTNGDEGNVLGVAEGNLYTTLTNAGGTRELISFDTSTAAFQAEGSGIDTGSTSQVNSITGIGDGDVYTGHADNTIRKSDSGSNSAVYGTGTGDDFVQDPKLLGFRGTLYALDGHDLYTVDTSTTDTRTLVTDTGMSYSPRPLLSRIVATDVGPAWFAYDDDTGYTFIWEYNHFTQTSRIVAQLPHTFISARAIVFAHGYLFVSYRATPDTNESGKAYVFYARGAQQGTIGPFRHGTDPDDLRANSGNWLTVAGVVGDSMFVVAGTATSGSHLYEYNLSTGALHNLSYDSTAIDTPDSAVVFANRVVGMSFTDGAWTYNFDAYDTDDGWFRTGRFDFGYPGIPKILQEVTVVTEPLADANMTVALDFSWDGSNFQSAIGSHSGLEAFSKTWTISDNSTSYAGHDFELKLFLNTTGNSSPIIRSVTAVATSAAKRPEWILELDASDLTGAVAGNVNPSYLTLSDLKTLATNNTIVQFSDPWFTRDVDGDETIDVVVEDVILPDVNPPNQAAFAQVKLRGVALVAASLQTNPAGPE